jgi:hypothetical protein
MKTLKKPVMPALHAHNRNGSKDSFSTVFVSTVGGAALGSSFGLPGVIVGALLGGGFGFYYSHAA